MVSKEQALKNYILLNMFLIKSYDELKDKIFSTPCLNYKDNCILNDFLVNFFLSKMLSS